MIEREKTVAADVDLTGADVKKRHGERAVDVKGLIVDVARSPFEATNEGNRIGEFLCTVRGG